MSVMGRGTEMTQTKRVAEEKTQKKVLGEFDLHCHLLSHRVEFTTLPQYQKHTTSDHQEMLSP